MWEHHPCGKGPQKLSGHMPGQKQVATRKERLIFALTFLRRFMAKGNAFNKVRGILELPNCFFFPSDRQGNIRMNGM